MSKKTKTIRLLIILSSFCLRHPHQEFRNSETFTTNVDNSIPVGTGNATISDGSLGKTIESILADLKPEAAYFCSLKSALAGTRRSPSHSWLNHHRSLMIGIFYFDGELMASFFCDFEQN
jgi:hypothetical protein